MQTVSPDFAQLKSGMKATWMAGDFGQIANFISGEAADFVARIDLKAGNRVLDVACGTGNSAIPAAKAGAKVTGVDIATNLLEQARKRAASEHLEIRFEEGDAELLPYADQSFDVVLSMFGAMFAPRPERVAAELLRVSKPGGLVAMANWTPHGFIAKDDRGDRPTGPSSPRRPAPGALGRSSNRPATIRATGETGDLHSAKSTPRLPLPAQRNRRLLSPLLRPDADGIFEAGRRWKSRTGGDNWSRCGGNTTSQPTARPPQKVNIWKCAQFAPEARS
jgi:SAM-dependent methyltransferase